MLRIFKFEYVLHVELECYFGESVHDYAIFYVDNVKHFVIWGESVHGYVIFYMDINRLFFSSVLLSNKFQKLIRENL